MSLRGITKTVLILSLVSLFTDTASEMLYPIMPLYLKSIGFSIFLIGILEGLAEGVAGLSKAYFGKLSDYYQRRMPFIQIGYGLSAITKPLFAIFISQVIVFMVRTVDRIGKGLRTGARDAILSDESTFETKGRVFGFHRSMDTIGAVIGPLSALVYLHYYPGRYRWLFIIAFIPGLIAVLLSFSLKDKTHVNNPKIDIGSAFNVFGYWKRSPSTYRKLVIGLLLFTLFNSSDVFLLLKVKQAGLHDTNVITMYIFYNIVYALMAYPIGIFSDRIGLKNTLILGQILFSAVYFAMPYSKNYNSFLFIFGIYGIYAAATEGISKALITNISDKNDTATAIGTFSGLQSICQMIASSFAGFLWFTFGSSTIFILSASASLIVAMYLGIITVTTIKQD